MKMNIIFVQFCTQDFLGKVPNRFRTDFLTQFDLRALIHIIEVPYSPVFLLNFA